MALSADGSGDSGSSAQDLESLDTYIQNTLSDLYPPFEATAATVLWQVFSVAERLHGGDGLRCLTDFLIPATRALQHLQQEACARYTGLIFFHEGWPLCIHGKVVVQLASLRGVRLRPGDFYLQVTSVGKQSARLVLKCLSRLGRGSEEVAVPEAMYGCVFTGEFLDRVNRERNSVLLKNCLLTSGSAVYRTPWSNVTVPVFVPTSGRVLPSCSSRLGPEKPPSSVSEAPAPAPAMASPSPQRSTSSSDTPTLPHSGGHPGSDQPSRLPSLRRAECESPRILPRSSDIGPWEPPENPEGPGERLDSMDKKDGPQALTSPEDAGSPNSRRRPPGSPAGVEARRWFRKSYMEALRNPMPLGSSSEESLEDEACSTQKKKAVTSLTQKETPGPQGDPQGIRSQESCPGTSGRTLTRRSRSWDRSLRSFRGDIQQVSPHSARAGPGGLLGGQDVGTRNLGSNYPSGCTKEEAGVNADGCSFPGHDPSRFPDMLAELLCSEGEGQLPSTGDLPNQEPRQVLEINQELLQSGAITLPGTRDRQGRAVVQVCMRSPLWSSQRMSSAELTRLLKYLHGIPRKEVRDLGLVILVDARKSLAAPALFQALAALQNTSPSIIHNILLLVDKESAFRTDKDVAIQCEVVGSLKALHKFVDSSQLTADLEGSFPYSHSDWICFRRKMEPFTTSCQDAIAFLQNLVGSLNTHRTLSTAQEVTELISEHKAIMKQVLEDTLLVALRLEGGTVLAQLRRKEHGASEDSRDSIEAASRLYNQVDEEVHRLVLTSNRCLQELERLRELRILQEEGDQIKSWFEKEEEKFLNPLELLSVENVTLQQRERQAGHPRPTQCCQKGRQLMEKNNSKDTEETVQDVGRCLSATAGRAEWKEGELAQWVRQPQFCEPVNRGTLRCSECLEPLGPELVAEYLKSCHQDAMEVSASMAVLGLGGQQALEQWHTLWLQCQQTRLCCQEALSEAASGPSAPPPGQRPLKRELVQGAEMKHREPSWIPLTDPEGHAGEWAQLLSSLPGKVALCGQEDEHRDPGVHTPDSSSTRSSEPIQNPITHHRKHPLKKIMKKTLSFEIPQLDSNPRDSHWPGHTGVFIKGLEVTSTLATEKKPPLRPRAESPLVTRNRSLSSPSRIHSSEEDRRRPAGSSRLQHVMAEMISTEREYVRSLGYVVDNYFPEMERVDLPQDLRGKRGVIFGNLEKLYDFHRQHFLAELEHCRHCPLVVGRSFLRHEEQFGMYALYSKNKPQSDALLCSHGHAFFKDKQRALGDKMDLASYLLKPVQRMGKYALLLQDLVKEAGRCPTHEQELGELKAAEDMVRFQLRHGNDLLAMDAVRGCDVNLKEQGQLRCRDEFIVCCGRKKYLRHIFLFEDLILFSKTRKVDGGYDIYTYKQSFKMAEIGLTETVGNSGVRFEIWFRRRRKSQDSYILQASSPEVKTMWTDTIGKILWRQALRNREVRMQEMVSMGLGSKPFLDIKPSDAAISDRAVNYNMNRTESRTQVSTAVPSRNHNTPFKRPHSTISDSSTSSSSSQSSAALHVSTSQAHWPWSYDVHACIEEDEPEQETESQPPLRTESSESSQCMSGDSSPGHPGLSQPLPPGLLSDKGSQSASSTFPQRDKQLDGIQFTTTVALQSLDSVAHNLYPLLFKASYLLERAEVIRVLLEYWPLEEFRLGALLGPSADHADDLRDRACRACLEACVRGLADHVLRGRRQQRLQLADLTGVRDVQVQQCPCGRTLGRWGRTELLARTCSELQGDPQAARRSIKVLADLFVTEGNFQVVMQALGPVGPAPLRLRCLSFRADSLDPSQLLQVLCLAGPGELRRLQVVHNVRLHAGLVQQLLAQLRFRQLSSLTLPAKAFDTPPACTPATEGEDPLLTAIAWELSQMTQLTELSVAFSTLTGKIQKLLGPLRTPLRALDLANCCLNHADMAFLADCTHATHLEVLDLSGHSLVHLFPSTFFRLLGRAAQTLRVLTLEECSIEDGHLSTLILALSPCHQLQELRFLGNPLSASALRRLFLALCELPKLRWVEFPVPKDCYPEGAAYPQDELAMSKFDQQKYDMIAEDLRGVLLRAGRDDIQVSTPVFGSFDPDIQETSNELGTFLLQAFKTALENFSRALKQME